MKWKIDYDDGEYNVEVKPEMCVGELQKQVLNICQTHLYAVEHIELHMVEDQTQTGTQFPIYLGSDVAPFHYNLGDLPITPIEVLYYLRVVPRERDENGNIIPKDLPLQAAYQTYLMCEQDAVMAQQQNNNGLNDLFSLISNRINRVDRMSVVPPPQHMYQNTQATGGTGAGTGAGAGVGHTLASFFNLPPLPDSPPPLEQIPLEQDTGLTGTQAGTPVGTPEQGYTLPPPPLPIPNGIDNNEMPHPMYNPIFTHAFNIDPDNVEDVNEQLLDFMESVFDVRLAGALLQARTQRLAQMTPAKKRVVSEEELESFVVCQYSELDWGADSGADSDKCGICLGGYEADDQVMVLPTCKHYYHQDCITPWLKESINCPVCRDECCEGELIDI